MYLKKCSFSLQATQGEGFQCLIFDGVLLSTAFSKSIWKKIARRSTEERDLLRRGFKHQSLYCIDLYVWEVK